jgi:uncharacterized membrane protein
MSDTTAAPARQNPDPVVLFSPRSLALAALAIAVMIAAINGDSIWFLNFIHVLAGILWTGIDLFMGLIVGPVLRRLDLRARRALITRLMPRMLYLMPTLAIVTSTAGYYLAERRGYLDESFDGLDWTIAALVIVAILTVQGIGMLLPTNVRVLLELKKPLPDVARITRWMRLYFWVIVSQAILQVIIIVIMARFVTGG